MLNSQFMSMNLRLGFFWFILHTSKLLQRYIFFGGGQEVKPGILKIGCQIVAEVKSSRKKYEFDPNVGETQKSRRLDALKRACLRS